jgi:hypothetical protein
MRDIIEPLGWLPPDDRELPPFDDIEFLRMLDENADNDPGFSNPDDPIGSVWRECRPLFSDRENSPT